MKGESCTKCYHFSPIKIKKDLYALHCKKHALPRDIQDKKTLEDTAEYCQFYLTTKEKKIIDKYSKCP